MIYKNLKKTPRSKSMKKSPRSKSMKKTPRSKSMKKTPRSKSMKKTPRSKSMKKTPLSKSMKKTPLSKSMKKSSKASIIDVSFGVELETCVLDTKLKKRYIEYPEEYFANVYNTIYQEKTKTRDNRFIAPDDEENLDYSKYNVVSDLSLSCSDNLEDTNFSPHLLFIRENEKIPLYKKEKIDGYFYPIEIVSPVIPYDELLLSFSFEFDEVLMNNRFIYETNLTQGLHINISHPKQNKLKFLQLWWYFEPFIASLVPFYRQNTKYAKFLRLGENPVFPNFEDILNWEKKYTHDDKKEIKYRAVGVKDNRFEIRIVNSNMNINHLNAWIEFLAKFLVISINTNITFKNIKSMSQLRKELKKLFGVDEDIIEELEMAFIEFQFRDIKIKN
jgi:hypothetical protein